MALTVKMRKFGDEYIANDFNGIKAAIACGQTKESAGMFAWRMLQNAAVLDYVAERCDELAAEAGLTVQWILKQWIDIASADPNELISVNIESCRHCYGKDHEYQWTEFEYTQALRAAAAHRCSNKCEPNCSKSIPPPNLGGFGFDPKIAPAEDCPACKGIGRERVVLKDSRRVKGPARRLYAGVKQTQHGIEVKFRDQDAALLNLAKFKRMVVEGREVSGPGGGAIPVTPVDVSELTTDQLKAIILRNEQRRAMLPSET